MLSGVHSPVGDSASRLAAPIGSSPKSLRTTLTLVTLYVSSLLLGWFVAIPLFLASPVRLPAKPLVDVFPGPAWRTAQTLSSTLLLSDKRYRVESHTVQGEDGRVYSDWIWMDVTDQVNVVPFLLPRSQPLAGSPAAATFNKWRAGEFIVFRQRKYGLAAESLAVAGGQIEMGKNELPLDAAKRETAEELFLQGDDAAWVDLGSYRVNVNRGHGTVSCFLLAGGLPLASTDGSDAEFKIDELERQSLVKLSVEEMRSAVRNHEFAEVKWMATAALALQEIDRRIAAEDERLGIATVAAAGPPGSQARALAADIPPPTIDFSDEATLAIAAAERLEAAKLALAAVQARAMAAPALEAAATPAHMQRTPEQTFVIEQQARQQAADDARARGLNLGRSRRIGGG